MYVLYVYGKKLSENHETLFVLPGHTDRVLHLALNPSSGSRLFSAGADGCINIWALETPAAVGSQHLTHSSAPEGIVEEEDLNLQPHLITKL